MRAGGRLARGDAAVALLGLLGLVLAGCLDQRVGRPDPGVAPGATPVTIDTADGLALAGRLWSADPNHLLIYLHEYRQDQTTWWPVAGASFPGQPSELTFDFRGHGASPGEPDDINGMEMDVAAAVAFARDRGYRQIVLVGAGMGAAVGMLAMAGDPAIGMVGFSAPSEFAELRPIDVAPAFAGRLVLIAARDDLSAVFSIRQLGMAARVPEWRMRLLSGRAHGAELLMGAECAIVLPFYERAIADLWQT